MLIQKTDILCLYVLHKSEKRVLDICEHIGDYYSEFLRYKTDKQGNKRRNKPKYLRFGEFWSRTINPPKNELKEIQKRINNYRINTKASLICPALSNNLIESSVE